MQLRYRVAQPVCRKQHLSNDYLVMLDGLVFTAIKPKGQIQMIDAMYNYRQGDIHSAEFSMSLIRLCIPLKIR